MPNPPYIIYGTVRKNNVNQNGAVVTIEDTSKDRHLDLSNNNLYTVNNAGLSANGKLGYCANFTSSEHWVGATLSSVATSEFSISLWFLVTDISARRNLFWRANKDDYYPRGYINTNGTIGFQYDVDGSTKSITTTNTISTDTWYHLICTIDADVGGKVYINNVEWGSSSHTGTTIDTGIQNTFFGRDTNFNDSMRGYIDEIMIYNRVLTAQERSDRYNNGTGDIFNPDNESGLLLYIRFDYPSDELTIDDADGNYVYDDLAEIPTSYTAGDIIKVSLEDGNYEYFTSAAAPEEKEVSFLYKTYQYDALLKKITDEPYKMDVLLKGRNDTNYKLDLLYKILNSEYDYYLDLLLKSDNDKTYNTDILLNKFFNTTFSNDIFIKGRNDTNYKLDLLFKELNLDKNYKLDIILDLVSILNLSYKSDILLKHTDQQIPYNLDSGLVGWWKMDEIVNGTTIEDFSGNNNDGTITGTTIVNGKIGNALSFDGLDDYVDVENNITKLSNFTIIAWIKPNDFSSIDGIITSADTALSYTKMWGIFVEESRIKIIVSNNISYQRYDIESWDASNYPTDTWTFIAATVGLNTITYYRNGVEIGNVPQTVQNSGTPYNIAIGRYGEYSATDTYFKGSMDDVRIYNRALSQEEITLLYNNPTYNIDILLKGLNNDNTYTINSLFKHLNASLSYNYDSLFKHLNASLSYNYDLLLENNYTKPYAINSLFKNINTDNNYNIDIKLINSYYKTHSIDLYLIMRKYITYKTNILLKKLDTNKNYYIDLLLITVINEIYNIDTLFKKDILSNLYIDILVKNIIATESYNIDCIISRLTTYKPVTSGQKYKPITTGKKSSSKITSLMGN